MTRFIWPHRWANVEILLIDILRFRGWPRGLLTGLWEHCNLLNLCVVADFTKNRALHGIFIPNYRYKTNSLNAWMHVMVQNGKP